MATNRALNRTRLSCFGIVIWAPRVVMTTMTRKELSAARELDTAEPLIMFTKPLSNLSRSRVLRRCFLSTAPGVPLYSFIHEFRFSRYPRFPFFSFTCKLLFPCPLFFSLSLRFFHRFLSFLSFFQRFLDKTASFSHTLLEDGQRLVSKCV